MSKRQYFGTDGIRGEANQPPMTAELALRVGMAAGRVFNRGEHRHKVVIAKDTRLSGYLLEPALTAGFISVGMDVLLVGPLPTPAVAMLTRSMRADLGVMISASHNPYADNGIKLFGPDGYKLSDETEAEIERLMDSDLSSLRATPPKLGRAKRIDDSQGRYIEFVKHSFPRHLRLDGIKIVLDCAHGAAYQVGPVILRELGAEVITLGITPDGFNINAECGSTAPQSMCEAVRASGAQLGIALDGDADRVVMCDERGAVIDGDQILALIAQSWHKNGRLRGGRVAATLMSNLGLERFLDARGIGLTRAAVGDRYVLEAMRAGGLNIGGEQSGHLIFSDYTTTGDGLIAALQVLAVMVEENTPMSQCARVFEPLPQKLQNVRYGAVNPLDNRSVQDAISEAQARLKGQGRLVIRKSGTEPVVRIMVEAETVAMVDEVTGSLARHMELATQVA
ncbi:MAG: phosphoglucosamine mutase [Rickettsiales bacterium]|nr:phosphoglucosamine mutase [Rickettsiales bacterium]